MKNTMQRRVEKETTIAFSCTDATVVLTRGQTPWPFAPRRQPRKRR